MKGLFITFEGGEGAGKSTQIEILALALRKAGQEIIKTREPGGTPEAEAIRSLIVHSKPGYLTPLSEALLHSAARAEHVAKVIKPALMKGQWVLCDRFIDSTLAYQGYGYGMNRDFLSRLAEETTGGLRPDLTFIIDVSVEKGLGRVKAAQSYEALGIAFHERVRLGFREIAQNEPRCQLLDANKPIEAISREISDCIHRRFGFCLPA